MKACIGFIFILCCFLATCVAVLLFNDSLACLTIIHPYFKKLLKPSDSGGGGRGGGGDTSEWLDISEGQNYSNYGDGTCSDNVNRQKLRDLLKRWIETATAHNVKYFLHGGSLLGAWRNGDVIPHDTDLDILVNVEEAPKLEGIEDPRNFTTNNEKFHLVLQRDWRVPYARHRVTCKGKVVEKMTDECSFEEPLGR